MRRINWKYWLKLAGAIISTITFIVFTLAIYFNDTNALMMDVVARDICYSFRGEKGGFWYWFFRIITEFGNLFVIAIVVIAALIITKCDFRFMTLSFGILCSVLLCIEMKELFMRERPIWEMRWMNEESTSFPSAHSTAAGFMYTYILYLVYHSSVNNKIKNFTYVICPILILLVMLSRMVLGVHYLSDVLAGVSIGVMMACVMMLIYKLCVRYDFMTKGLFSIIKEEKN